MGKRQIRIFAKDISNQLPALIDQEVNILLKNGTVFHGIIRHSPGPSLIMKDMLGRNHALATENIAEIILDKETLY
jgi:hypothetical protein